MIRWISGLVLCFLILPVQGPQAQDRVVLKNGSAFTGKLLEDSREWVVIKSSMGTLRFKKHAVEKVEHGSSQFRGGTRRSGSQPRQIKGRKRKNLKPVKGFVKAAPGAFGDLKKIRVDRHPAYASLKRSEVGAWVLYTTPGKMPHHDQERWVIKSVSAPRTVVIIEHLLRGSVVGFEQRTLNLLDFGPEMPARIQKENAFGMETIRTSMGRFATLRISKDYEGLPGPTKNFCPEVPILGLVQYRIGHRLFRRVLRFAWKGGAGDHTPKDRGRSGAATGGKSDRSRAQVKPLPPNPVAAAYLQAKPGDLAVWRDPATGKRWREIVQGRSRTEVTLQVQVWRVGKYAKGGVRTYDLGFLGGDYLDRHVAVRAGEEILRIGGSLYHCTKWRSASGTVEFWTSPRVHIGALVRHAIHGKVVGELLETGNNVRLLMR